MSWGFVKVPAITFLMQLAVQAIRPTVRIGRWHWVGGIVDAAGLGALFVSLGLKLAGSSILTARAASPDEKQ